MTSLKTVRLQTSDLEDILAATPVNDYSGSLGGPPGVTDDINSGWLVGSEYLDGELLYTCTDASPGAAVWVVRDETAVNFLSGNITGLSAPLATPSGGTNESSSNSLRLAIGHPRDLEIIHRSDFITNPILPTDGNTIFMVESPDPQTIVLPGLIEGGVIPNGEILTFIHNSNQLTPIQIGTRHGYRRYDTVYSLPGDGSPNIMATLKSKGDKIELVYQAGIYYWKSEDIRDPILIDSDATLRVRPWDDIPANTLTDHGSVSDAMNFMRECEILDGAVVTIKYDAGAFMDADVNLDHPQGKDIHIEGDDVTITVGSPPPQGPANHPGIIVSVEPTTDVTDVSFKITSGYTFGSISKLSFNNLYAAVDIDGLGASLLLLEDCYVWGGASHAISVQNGAYLYSKNMEVGDPASTTYGIDIRGGSTVKIENFRMNPGSDRNWELTNNGVSTADVSGKFNIAGTSLIHSNIYEP